MTMRPDGPSTEERLNALHARLVDAVADLVHSENWARMLAVAARFPTYSPSNVLLIAAQRPDATQVAGIRTWNALGRHVTKGQHGIAILAPCVYRSDDAEEQPNDSSTSPLDASGAPRRAAGLPRTALHGFRVVHVFDVSQTEGQPVPDLPPRLLTGEAPAGLWEQLGQVAANDGYELHRQACPPGVNGWTAPDQRLIVVATGLEPAQAVKTLTHELAHIRSNHAGRFPEYATDRACRGVAEVEAESVAYVVASHLGMAVDDYSVPYVAGWATDLDVLRHHMSTVVTVAQGLVTDIDRATSPVGIATASLTSRMPTAEVEHSGPRVATAPWSAAW